MQVPLEVWYVLGRVQEWRNGSWSFLFFLGPCALTNSKASWLVRERTARYNCAQDEPSRNGGRCVDGEGGKLEWACGKEKKKKKKVSEVLID